MEDTDLERALAVLDECERRVSEIVTSGRPSSLLGDEAQRINRDIDIASGNLRNVLRKVLLDRTAKENLGTEKK